MKNNPTVSIAIPTLNEEKNIRRCLHSIFNQEYQGKLEISIVDGGSRDRTLEIAKSFPVRIIQNSWVDAEHGKMLGLKKARGKYFLYLDADIDLPGKHWFDKMLAPLEKEPDIVASFTKFVSYPNDNSLNKYITLNPFQLSPLLQWFTPKIESLVVERKKGYSICENRKGKYLPTGLCILRRKQILSTEIGKREKFMELDNVIILFNKGLKRFAYVPQAGLHHPSLSNVISLLKKRIRNINTMFLGQPHKRYWVWVDFSRKSEIFMLVLWIIYSLLFIPALIVGIFKSVRYRTFVGLYEPIIALLPTNVIILTFLLTKNGREFILRSFLKKSSP